MNEYVNLSFFYNNQINNRKLSDKLGRYYTPISIAEVLCSQMGTYENRLVLDLGCGTGNLILGSLKHWINCQYHAYDIDNQALNQLINHNLKNVHPHHLDIIDLNTKPLNFDLAISNPPYVYLSKEKLLNNLDKNTELENEILKLNKIPAPLIFLTKAIRHVKTNGKIGIILPNGILTNRIYQSIRNILINSYHIECVIQLEPYVFEKTETHAHILILNNTPPQSKYNINFYKLKNNNLVSHELKSNSQVSTRLDFLPNTNNDYIHKLGDFISSISRGRKSSKYIKNNPTCKIFHTTDFNKKSGKYIDSYFTIKNPTSSNFAQKGDILIARVGRNFQKKIKIVKDNFIEISDSIIAIKPIENHTDFIYSYLISEFGQNQLMINSQGTGAKYITHSQIQNLPIIYKMDQNDGF